VGQLLRQSAPRLSFQIRFMQERQILAGLQHPGIARLLDAGGTAKGRPYLVLDYVDGVPIDVYCRKLDLRSKLRLFLPLCDAVAYAHRNLVIHRDVKPSNILSTRRASPSCWISASPKFSTQRPTTRNVIGRVPRRGREQE
jgi:serine/threonine protein kinase